MNKAFIREPDDTGERHCPVCGSLGIAVQQPTLAAQLKPDAVSSLAAAAYYCPFARCDVAYFDVFDRVVKTDALHAAVYPKNPDAPMCACFGLTEDDIDQDIREGGVTRVRKLLERAKSDEARCTTLAASGQCCVPDVQRYYLRARSRAES